MKFPLSIKISIELHSDCVALFKLCDEFSNPEKLRAFAVIDKLELVRECIPHSNTLDFDLLLSNLLKWGRSFLEPTLFDLLDVLEVRYKEDGRGKTCQELKEKLRKEIPQAKDPEQADYQKLIRKPVEGSGPDDRQNIAHQARQWMEAAGDNLDEIALRITLAIFNGASFEYIEEAKKDLLESLQEIMPAPPPKTDDAPHIGIPVPLMRRFEAAEAYETDPEPPDCRRVIQLHNPDLAGEATFYIWKLYRDEKWRQKLVKWLRSYAVGHPVDVRTRAAVAIGRLALTDYRFVRDKLFDLWISSENHPAEYRAAMGMVLGVIVREKKWTAEVQNLLREWSQSEEQAKRWAATRAYIYVGAYWRPAREVIERWRDIAASEIAAITIPITQNFYLRLENPLHMSLVDAMMRLFMNIAQLPEEEEKRLLFESILEGLEVWIADDENDAYLGLFAFTMLGRMILLDNQEQVEGPPVLLQLVEKQPAQSGYRKRLAGLFYLALRKAASVIEAKELLCTWVEWTDGLQVDSSPYEARIQALLMDITAADNTGGVRGQLSACLRSCGGSATAARLLASL